MTDMRAELRPRRQRAGIRRGLALLLAALAGPPAGDARQVVLDIAQCQLVQGIGIEALGKVGHGWLPTAQGAECGRVRQVCSERAKAKSPPARSIR